MTAVPYGREVAVSSRRERHGFLSVVRHLDLALIGSAVALALTGVVMVYTATRNQLLALGLNPHADMERQALWTLIGIIVMVVVAAVDYRHYKQWGYILYGLVLCSLVGVFALGKSVYGSQRWYQLGPLQLQPSEFAVLALIIVVATYCGRRTGVLALRETLALLVLAGVPLVLVYKQPDLGTTIILGITLAAMLLAAGVRMRYLGMLLVCVVGGFYLAIHLHILQQYQLDRLTSFLQQNKGLRTTNYDVNMSKNAISAGGTYGTGIGKGAATNLSFIPNQETDFIFSAVGEQLGFVGSAVVVALFGVIAFRMMRAAQIAKDTFGRLLAAGSLAFLSFSVFENIGMATGIMPVTGIPLPFISYGGSASFAFFACIGLVVNVEMRRVARR